MRQAEHMKIARLATGLLLAGAFAVGCSPDADTPEEPEPSAQELFCEAFSDFYDRSSQNASATDAEVVASMKAFAAEASELEIPETMSTEAKLGLATWIDLMNDVPDDASQADVAALGERLSAKQNENLDAYYLYSNATCLSTTN